MRAAIRESQEEANLRQAIQQSLQQCPAIPEPAPEHLDLRPQPWCPPEPESVSLQLARPTKSGLLRQRSAPCIASELADAEVRMASAQVPLAAWRSPFASPARNATRTRGATRWEQAVERAACAANAYAVGARKRGNPAKTKPKATAPTRGVAEEPWRLYPTVPVCGRPPAPIEHHRVLELAMPEKPRDPLPRCSNADFRGRTHGRVMPYSEEYEAVIEYFRATVGRYATFEVQELIRLQNRYLYDSGPGPDTIMFHGCKTLANESSIIAHGFQVKCCKSGGQQFGTWFAYGAEYSNNGYAYVDPQGIRHLFVCVVSSKHVVLDNPCMRVVGQGCAYPAWLLKYKCDISTRAVYRKVRTASAPSTFYVVRGGSWVLE